MATIVPEVRSFFHAKISAIIPPPVAPSVVLTAPDVDTEDEVGALRPSSGTIEHAEGQSFVLHYKDADGNISTRSVSVWAIRHTDAGIPVLVARCYLRKATRYFRVDRIEAVADFDGVVIEPTSKFLADTFGVRWPPSKAELAAAAEVQMRWSRLRTICRENGAALLTAVGLADGELVPDEVGAILDFVGKCCRRVSFDCGERENDRLRLYIRRLRPTPELIDRAVDHMAQSDPATVVETLSACVRVMEADGHIHPAERKMLDGFSQAMTGLPLQYP
ncbi:WYL domain-containing protein [Bradyrhizobium macuxiense]|uniref:tellurite resistance TerB family protein n=1 Tax=Bradyrhizobium macuxiense TaxID=1755647 RepID=UPI000B04446E|nr:WYL domain-containing protein [Bradyrhizobium macuxiense]